MEVTAKARFIRMSPRKVRLVAGLIRGLDIEAAEAQLAHSQKAATRPVLKLLRSAIANAENNHKLDREDLFVKIITVDGGPVLKRWRARAFGRAAPIRKRTSHINIILADRLEEEDKKGKKASGLKAALVKDDRKAPAKKPAAKKAADKKDDKKSEKKAPAKKPAAKKAADKKPADDKKTKK